MNEDEAAQQPVAEPTTPAEPTEPQEAQEAPETQEESQPEPSQEATSQEPQQSNEGADAPQPSEDEEPASDPDWDPVGQYANFNQVNPNNLPLLEDGSIDPVAYAQQIQQQTLNQVRFEQKEARDWQAIDKKWGDQMTPNRRKLILNSRIALAVEGKNGNLRKVADDIMKEFGASKSEGRAEASVSRKVQNAASLETATANSAPPRNDNLMDRIADGDKAAATSLFDDWLKDGKI